MPRELTCTCGDCRTCRRRAYNRAVRLDRMQAVRGDNWAQQAEGEAWILQRYVCPLAEVAEYGLTRSSRRAAAE